MAKVEEVLARHQDRLMAIPDVVGVGEGEQAGRPVIKIMVRAVTPELRRTLPQHLDGIPVEIEASGEVSAF